MKKAVIWIVRLVPAIILLQTLFFKFTGAEESVYIFTTLRAEPYGRIGSGVMELVAAILLLIPSKSHWGAFLGAGVMAGAIASHLFVLGIEVKNDGSTLFILAVVTFVLCAAIVVINRNKFFNLLK
ncbi:DoxX family protein [Flavobacterium salilacus subsp. salilacus]|uniref:DoxX family protein n=1 Tax=Flavobacterium TaxID=237 RepID=UPI001074DE94|nr:MULTISPECIES: DoxX family protein [Flavobacterium]KAF2517561.1 DoxX family protein [Flavobacterium salilacus subsp. salilacus]MBE1615710.1 DoxX family protein [Flavobacterium sp. SaA2.13]